MNTVARTFCGELFTIAKALLAGQPSPSETTKVIEVRESHYTSNGIAGYFVDPYDGQEYAIAIMPKHLFEHRKDSAL